jgi:ABC-type phosphate/phosphonate transport system substrate-binding protein
MKYCDKQVGFQVAVGNYSDVLEWWHNKQIDVGIFSAAPTGRLLALEQEEVKEAYVGSLDDTAFWSPDSFASTPRPIYRSMAVVANKPENRDVVSIEDASKKGMHLRFLFVRPDSASGNLIPRYFLGKSRIPVTDWSFT